MRLGGKLAVVTAAASGMGREGCKLFAKEGATVAAVDIDEVRLDALCDEIRVEGGSAVPIVADLTRRSECERAIKDAAEGLGGIHLLWNHAGIPGPSGIEDVDQAEYDKTMQLNVDACVIASGTAVPIIRRSGGGAMLFTASSSGLVGSMFSPIYSASKFAVVGLAKSLAIRLAPDGIRVNAICPGITDTPMMRGFTTRNNSEEEHQTNSRIMFDAIPMRRAGTPKEIAQAALWLLSDEASYVTGVALPIDGGFTAR